MFTSKAPYNLTFVKTAVTFSNEQKIIHKKVAVGGWKRDVGCTKCDCASYPVHLRIINLCQQHYYLNTETKFFLTTATCLCDNELSMFSIAIQKK